jgi:hypothetical protein
MKKQKKAVPILFHVTVGRGSQDNPMLMRVILDPNFTQLDFAYQAMQKYIRGGWIRIASYTHLRVKGDSQRYALIEAKGIPIAPNQLDFESTADWQYFTLYFEPLPRKDLVFDMLEEENPSPTDFNFYSIKINLAEGIPVLFEK